MSLIRLSRIRIGKKFSFVKIETEKVILFRYPLMAELTPDQISFTYANEADMLSFSPGEFHAILGENILDEVHQ